MTKISNDTRYGYAIGQVRVREGLLFDRNRYEQLIAAENEEHFLRILANSPYSQFPKSNVEEILNDAHNENFLFLRKYCRDKSVLDLFSFQEDLHNLKLFIKAKIGQAPSPELYLSPFGTISIPVLNALSEAFVRKETDLLSTIGIEDFWRTAILKAKTVYETTNEPKLLDCELDKATLGHLCELAKVNDFLYGYFQKKVDLTNIEILLRIRFFQDKESLLTEALIPGGTIELDFLKELFFDLIERISEKFALTQYGTVVADGMNYLINNKSFIRFERLATEHLLSFLSKARFFTFGYEPLIGYFLFKENEIKNLRKLFQGLRMRVNKEMLRETIAYV
ncbi:MAG: V-type ATPase subunit [candidate division WOR-3 bacterium]